ARVPITDFGLPRGRDGQSLARRPCSTPVQGGDGTRERLCIVDRERLPVVVEVRPRRELPGADPRGPLEQLTSRVVAAPTPVPVVEADIRPRRGHPDGLEEALGMIAEDEGDAVALELVVDVVHEPARVTELEAVQPFRDLSQ